MTNYKVTKPPFTTSTYPPPSGASYTQSLSTPRPIPMPLFIGCDQTQEVIKITLDDGDGNGSQRLRKRITKALEGVVAILSGEVLAGTPVSFNEVELAMKLRIEEYVMVPRKAPELLFQPSPLFFEVSLPRHDSPCTAVLWIWPCTFARR